MRGENFQKSGLTGADEAENFTFTDFDSYLAHSLNFFSVELAQTTHWAKPTWVDTLNPSGTTYSVYRAPGLCSGPPILRRSPQAQQLPMGFASSQLERQHQKAW
jgi:hypothetical protein